MNKISRQGGFCAATLPRFFFIYLAFSLTASFVVAQTAPEGDVVGIPWNGQPGVAETVSNIMARTKNLPLQSYLQPAQSDEGRLIPNRQTLGSPHPPHG